MKIALKQHQHDPEIVAAAIAALAALYRGRFPSETELDSVDPATKMLAALQTVNPKLLDSVSLAINIDTADPELLKLALIVVGLNRDIQHLLHPRHANGAIVRALGEHDDPIVRQYSIWAVIENARLGPEHLGIPFAKFDKEPDNVQAKLLQLAPSAIKDPIERQEIIIAGSNLQSVDAREGLAKGVSHCFYDGLQDVTIAWAATESEDRVLLPLAEHFARYADEVPSYREEAMTFLDRGSAYQERVRLGAEGTKLYADVRLGADRTESLFGDNADMEQRTMIERVKAKSEYKVLMLNATPDPQQPVPSDYRPIRPEIEAMELRERMKGVQEPHRSLTFETVYATRPDQIQQELLRNNPKILHFSGHGNKYGLAFESREGEAIAVKADVLKRIVKAYGDLECLILHACYSNDIAQACAPHVQHVIGSIDAINDDLAPKFTYVFYQAIATGRPFEKAFKMGQNEVALVSEKEADKYIMHSR